MKPWNIIPSELPKRLPFKYDPERSDITVEQINDRIVELLKLKKIKNGDSMAPVAFAVVDIETTGLREDENIILELGIVLLDRELNTIATFSSIIANRGTIAHVDWLQELASDEPKFRGKEPWFGAKNVFEMHTKNGLISLVRGAAASGNILTLDEVAQNAVNFLRSNNVGAGLNELPMTGSSVSFDRRFIRAQMPTLDKEFHYRNIDISTLKGLVDMYRADVVQNRNTSLDPKREHRALPDCFDSISELRFYLNHLFAKGPVL